MTKAEFEEILLADPEHWKGAKSLEQVGGVMGVVELFGEVRPVLSLPFELDEEERVAAVADHLRRLSPLRRDSGRTILLRNME
jgi:hypothetical protein